MGNGGRTGGATVTGGVTGEYITATSDGGTSPFSAGRGFVFDTFVCWNQFSTKLQNGDNYFTAL